MGREHLSVRPCAVRPVGIWEAQDPQPGGPDDWTRGGKSRRGHRGRPECGTGQWV